MGSIGNPIVTGLVQAAQAQQVAARDRDRTRNSEAAARERADTLDLRVTEAEAPEAVGPAGDDGGGGQPQHGPASDAFAEPAAGGPDDAAEDAGSGGDAEDEPPRLDLQA